MCTQSFVSQTGLTYEIYIDDDGSEIIVLQNRKPVGSITLRKDDDDLPGIPESFFITNLSLDNCRRQGLGRKCLQFHIECFGAPIYAGENDGNRQSDGNHLTGDGPGFIAKMREEGIVEKSSYDDLEPFEEDY